MSLSAKGQRLLWVEPRLDHAPSGLNSNRRETTAPSPSCRSGFPLLLTQPQQKSASLAYHTFAAFPNTSSQPGLGASPRFGSASPTRDNRTCYTQTCSQPGPRASPRFGSCFPSSHRFSSSQLPPSQTLHKNDGNCPIFGVFRKNPDSAIPSRPGLPFPVCQGFKPDGNTQTNG